MNGVLVKFTMNTVASINGLSKEVISGCAAPFYINTGA
jgi:hypothetical protein